MGKVIEQVWEQTGDTRLEGEIRGDDGRSSVKRGGQEGQEVSRGFEGEEARVSKWNGRGSEIAAIVTRVGAREQEAIAGLLTLSAGRNVAKGA